mgnify:CR=1 FL=1
MPPWLNEWQGDGIIARIQNQPIAEAVAVLTFLDHVVHASYMFIRKPGDVHQTFDTLFDLPEGSLYNGLVALKDQEPALIPRSYRVLFNDIREAVDTIHRDGTLKRRVIAPYTESGRAKDWQESDSGRFRLTHPSNLWTDLTVPFWSMLENTDHPTQKPEKLLAAIAKARFDIGSFSQIKILNPTKEAFKDFGEVAKRDLDTIRKKLRI